MDKKFGHTWHVIVGKGFSYEITYEVRFHSKRWNFAFTTVIAADASHSEYSHRRDNRGAFVETLTTHAYTDGGMSHITLSEFHQVWTITRFECEWRS